jgi:hypothetical protein
VVGVVLDAASASLSAVVQGNTFTGSPVADQGVEADGSGVTATIGGSGSQENTFQNYANGSAIVQANVTANPPISVGYPNLTILGNNIE